jgi:diguanylate cyclase (GGDEF)-like protein
MMEPDLFDVENAALAAARGMHDDTEAGAADYRRVLGELIAHYERLMRETRRLIRRSDRAERDMNQLNRQLHELAGQLEYRATHDPLTGALNRGAVIAHASRCLELGDIALIVLDIDHFKQVNDDFGHPAGDAVIQAVVDCLNRLMGDNVAIGRVGGEEFSVVWPTASKQEAAQVAQRICDAIGAQIYAAPIDRAVSASVGVSWNPRGTTFETAYGRADEALYQAKRNGRNQIRLFELAHHCAT